MASFILKDLVTNDDIDRLRNGNQRRSRKQKRKNKPVTMFDSGPCDWLVLPLLLPTPQPSFHWIVSDGVVNGIGRNENILILPTPIPSSS